MTVLELDDVQLQKLIAQALQNWPLYRRLEYKGAENSKTLPAALKLFCPTCNFDTSWLTNVMVQKPGHPRGTLTRENHKVGFLAKIYKCRNCGNASVTYYLRWETENGVGVFCKVGQFPELEEQVSDTLAKALNTEDLKAYKNALRLRNFNLGIAAMAYMRRVIENRMNDMLEILHEAARVHNAAPETLARLEEVKKEKRFSVKVDYAGDLLPANLRPDGQPNPMAVLHDLASDGLHARSDEECVDIFDECRQTFEYVFGRMRIETEHAKSFVKGMAKLAEKRARTAEPKPPAGEA